MDGWCGGERLLLMYPLFVLLFLLLLVVA